MTAGKRKMYREVKIGKRKSLNFGEVIMVTDLQEDDLTGQEIAIIRDSKGNLVSAIASFIEKYSYPVIGRG